MKKKRVNKLFFFFRSLLPDQPTGQNSVYHEHCSLERKCRSVLFKVQSELSHRHTVGCDIDSVQLISSDERHKETSRLRRLRTVEILRTWATHNGTIDWRTDRHAVRKDAPMTSAVTSSFIPWQTSLSSSSSSSSDRHSIIAIWLKLVSTAAFIDGPVQRRNYRLTTRYYRAAGKPLPVSSLPSRPPARRSPDFDARLQSIAKRDRLFFVFW